MSGIDGIVAEIEAKARESAAETVAAAMSERERALGEAKERLENALNARKNALEREAQEVIRRRTTLAGPQARMLVLGAKQAELEKVFESARADLRKDRKAYARFWLSLAAKACEDGDEVCSDEDDADVIDAKWTERLEKASGKKLTYGKNVRIGGGLLLVGKTTEKDLSLPTVLEEYRVSLERETAELLFGE